MTIIFQIFEVALFVSAWTLGLSTAASKGMLMHSTKLWLEHWAYSEKNAYIQRMIEKQVKLSQLKKTASNTRKWVLLENEIKAVNQAMTFKEYIAKPLLLCPLCMPSVHGFLWTALFRKMEVCGTNNATELLFYITVPVVAVFFNSLLYKHTYK